MSLLQSITKNALGQIVALFKDGKTEALMRSTPQVNLTVTDGGSDGWSTVRAVGIYYQDQGGNHRLKFNITGTLTSSARTVNSVNISGVTFKAGADNYQPVSGFAYTASAAVIPMAYAAPGGSSLWSNYSSATTTRVGWSGDIELNSKPTWA